MVITASTETTIKNLQAAYEGESNAAHKYGLFAVRAGQDGYQRVATLFRAASRAETIHAANHARVLQRLGATPAAEIHEPDVNTTAENLKVALAGEEYERDVMYPDFIREAESQHNAAAVRTFQLAMEAEAGHAALYSNAIETLENQRTATTFYVCTVCGFTTDDASLMRCLICNTPKEKFDVIN